MTENDHTPLPGGKLPPALLLHLLSQAPVSDPRVQVGPGVGLDCAVLDLGGPNLLVLKSDPITFATDEIGWYAVQVNANDIATTGGAPRWMMATLLLPDRGLSAADVEAIFTPFFEACRGWGISVLGGHTEITAGLDRPLLSCTLIGEVARERLVTPRGARPGDRLLLTKGIPIEAVSILAREFPERLRPVLGDERWQTACAYLHTPGISVLRDAQIAQSAGAVHAMHDPTEGGLAGALWELAEASGRALRFDPAAVVVPPLAAEVCAVFGLDPLATIASGALLLAVAAADQPAILAALAAADIPASDIGEVLDGSPRVWQDAALTHLLPRPQRDEINRVFDSLA